MPPSPPPLPRLPPAAPPTHIPHEPTAIAIAQSGAESIRVHIWQDVQAHVAFLRLRVLVEGALVDEMRVLFEPDGTHQLEHVDDLVCSSLYTIFLSACTEESDWLGGCSPEINASATTSPCAQPPPPPLPPFPPHPPPHGPTPSPPPASPPPPLPPPRPELYGCTNPGAATYDAGALVDDATQCVSGIWGCTLPTSTNHLSDANLNDGSCTFPTSRCVVPLVAEPFWAQAGANSWPASVNRSADGAHACEISPAVRYQRCISLVPPTAKSMDVVISFTLPAAAVEATVEVGLDPRASRQGNAEFELRALTEQGEVIASDLTIRRRTGLQSLPALLRVQISTASAAVLQLVVNDQDGDATNDLIVWADPLVYCEGSCPCTAGSSLATLSDAAGQLGSKRPTARNAGGSHVVDAVLLVCALGLCAAAIFVTMPRSHDDGSSRSRVIGKVQIVRHDDGDKLALMEDCDDDDDATARAGEDEATANNPRGEGWDSASDADTMRDAPETNRLVYLD